MTFEEYKAERRRLWSERDAALISLEEQIAQLIVHRLQTIAIWDTQIHEQVLGDIVAVESTEDK